MTVMEKMRMTQLPEYYKTMYRDGFSPYEVLQSARDTFTKRQEEQEADAPMTVHFGVEGVE